MVAAMDDVLACRGLFDISASLQARAASRKPTPFFTSRKGRARDAGTPACPISL
jgi:hypothetical protein